MRIFNEEKFQCAQFEKGLKINKVDRKHKNAK